WPRIVIAPMHTTMMSANITAYSTAVGPSSRFKKLTTGAAIRVNMAKSPYGERNKKVKQRTHSDRGGPIAQSPIVECEIGSPANRVRARQSKAGGKSNGHGRSAIGDPTTAKTLDCRWPQLGRELQNSNHGKLNCPTRATSEAHHDN